MNNYQQRVSDEDIMPVSEKTAEEQESKRKFLDSEICIPSFLFLINQPALSNLIKYNFDGSKKEWTDPVN